MNFASKLIELRRLHALSQESLAERLDISRQAVSRWENGASMPDAQNLLQMSKIFGVTVDFLLNDNYQEDNNTTISENLELRQIKQQRRDVRACTRALLVSTAAMAIIALLVFTLIDCGKNELWMILIPSLAPLPLLYLATFHYESINRSSVLVVSLIILALINAICLPAFWFNLEHYHPLETGFFILPTLLILCNFPALSALSAFIPYLNGKRNWKVNIFSFLISVIIAYVYYALIIALCNLLMYETIVLQSALIISQLAFIISWYFVYSEGKRKSEKV